MEAITFIILGIVVSINFCIIVKKWRLRRYFDSIVDTTFMAIISVLFCGTFSGFVVGNIASAMISLYLYFNPLTLKEVIPQNKEEEDEDIDEARYRKFLASIR